MVHGGVTLIRVATRTTRGSTILGSSYGMHPCVSSIPEGSQNGSHNILFTSDGLGAHNILLASDGLVLHSLLVHIMHVLVLVLSIVFKLSHAPGCGTGGDDGRSEGVERFLEYCVDLLQGAALRD